MKTFYVLICRLYNYVFTKYEELFFRSSLKDNSFEINYLGYEKINYKNDLNIVTSQEEININQYMLDNNYAYAYFGGTKQGTQI